MIASLRGPVTYVTPQLRKDSYAVIEAGGVGYKVFVPATTIARFEIGKEALVFTYHSVSEHAQDLYGFLRPAEKTFFVLLLTVPGIGPKSAMGILEKTSMAEVQEAVMNDDPKLLTTQAGLSLKTAEKIVVSLRDKIESLSAGPKEAKEKGRVQGGDDAFAVLLTFGYSPSEAKQALAQIDDNLTTSDRVRAALKELNRQNKITK